MRTHKRLLALLLSLCMVLSLMPTVWAEEAPSLAAEDEVVIYYTNDVHTYIDKDLSYDNIASLKDETAKEAAGVLLVDAGDHLQGTAYGSMDKGATIIELMNAAGYDLATLGNHEFDYDMDGAMAAIEAADYPYISANFYNEGEYVNPFKDVGDNWFASYVLHLAQRGIIKGQDATTFAPNSEVTRAEFVTMLYRVYGEPDVTGLQTDFTDLTKDWYKAAVIWAANEGIVKGMTPTKFDPAGKITREQMVTMLYRAAGEPDVSGNLNGFEDKNDVHNWAWIAMVWAVKNGVVEGVTTTSLQPTGEATRAQATKIMDVYFYDEQAPLDTVLDSYQIFEVGGLKLAFIGVTTPESFTKSTPAYFQDDNGNYIYGIAGGEDGTELYEAVQNAIDEVKRIHQPDYVIALAHLGDDLSSQPWTSEELIANITGLDALIDGHSHSTVPMKEVDDAEGNTVVLTQTGEYLNAIGRMSITEDGIETELMTEYTGSDAEVKAIKDAWIEKIDEELGVVIGKAEITFDNYDADGKRLVRKQETNTGDFCADALYYLFDSMGLDVDCAIMNGGGVRNKAITGDISYKTCKEIHTFGNVACLVTVTGQQILDALEWGAKSAGAAESGGFLQVSGLKYTIDTSIESTVEADEKGVWTGGPTGEYRVQDVMILQDGEYVELDLDAEYNLAGYNYTLRDLGDGFAMFDGSVNVLDYVMEDYLVLANYVKSFENGVIGADSIYADVYGEGRITVLTAE